LLKDYGPAAFPAIPCRLKPVCVCVCLCLCACLKESGGHGKKRKCELSCTASMYVQVNSDDITAIFTVACVISDRNKE